MAQRRVIKIGCSCKQCRYELHRFRGKCIMKSTIRSWRQRTKQLLQLGNYDAALDVIVACPYTS